MNRYTFVLHAYPGEPSMLENVSTREQVRIQDLAAVGPQVERWLACLTNSATELRSEPRDLVHADFFAFAGAR